MPAGEETPSVTALHAAPRCGAKTRAGGCCGQPAMPNGRCKLHGGKSTGPRTVEGLERIRQARTKHGWHSAEMVAFRRQTRAILGWLRTC
jgi:hypothetical protein